MISANYSYAYICSGSTSNVTTQITGFRASGEYAMSASDGTRIYKTSVTGVGYAVGGLIGNCQTTGWVSSGSKILGDVNTINLCSAKDTAVAATPQIQLYKIAQTTKSGTVSAKVVGNVAMAVDGAFYPTAQSAISMNTFNIITPGCTVNTPTINVSMGNVVKNQFNGQGTSLNDMKNINISLNCPADTNVLMQIDGDILDSTQGLLKIKSETGSATGVAIQLLYNNLPFSLGTPISVGTAVTEGTFTTTLQTRYYQSGATVTPGSANGSATFTLTYQ